MRPHHGSSTDKSSLEASSYHVSRSNKSGSGNATSLSSSSSHNRRSSRRNECVAVRDSRTGEWMQGHLALRSRVSGGLTFLSAGGVRASDGVPSVGESLFFVASGRDLVTSPIVRIERPVREIVEQYED